MYTQVVLHVLPQQRVNSKVFLNSSYLQVPSRRFSSKKMSKNVDILAFEPIIVTSLFWIPVQCADYGVDKLLTISTPYDPLKLGMDAQTHKKTLLLLSIVFTFSRQWVSLFAPLVEWNFLSFWTRKEYVFIGTIVSFANLIDTFYVI